MTEKLLDVYVVWSLDGPIMTTLLQFEDDDMSRQAQQQWSPQDYVVQACDAEFPGEENHITAGHSYELNGDKTVAATLKSEFSNYSFYLDRAEAVMVLRGLLEQQLADIGEQLKSL